MQTRAAANLETSVALREQQALDRIAQSEASGKLWPGSIVFDPFRALRRVGQGGRDYWRAWGIALAALGLSFLGLLAFGIGFLVTSVWFWQVAGFSFATVFAPQVHRMSEHT